MIGSGWVFNANGGIGGQSKEKERYLGLWMVFSTHIHKIRIMVIRRSPEGARNIYRGSLEWQDPNESKVF